MNQSFDVFALGLVSLISLLVGYLIGRLVGGNSRVRPLPVLPVTSAEARDELRTLVVGGNRLGAIRRLRELTGAGLEDATRAIEAVEREEAGTRLGLLPVRGRPNER